MFQVQAKSISWSLRMFLRHYVYLQVDFVQLIVVLLVQRHSRDPRHLQAMLRRRRQLGA